MERTLIFNKYSINNNLFRKNKNPININKVDVSFLIKYLIEKRSLSIICWIFKWWFYITINSNSTNKFIY